jgi:stage III sporulation protein AB
LDVKIVGVLLVMGASSLIGFGCSNRLIGRCRMLKTWLYILEILKGEIYYQDNLLPEVFLRIARGIDDDDLAHGFDELARLVTFGSGVELREAWRNCPVRAGSYYLNQSDCLILTELGDYLGNTDREDQREKIQRCQSRLQHNLNLAETDQHKKLNLFRYLGFAAGAVLVLCLI